MKKFSILFVVMAVVCLTCAAFAQENDFSGYLGVWYADSFCYKGECFPDFLSGYDTKLEIGSDFTVTRIYHYFFSNLYEYENWDDDTFTGQWYTEDDIVYSKLVVNGGSNGKEYAYKYELTEDGNLIEFYSNDSFLIYTRDYRTEWGNGPVKENAELEDFLGKWMVYKTGNPKWVERVDGFDSEVWQYVDGGKGTLNIEKDNIDVNVEAITLWHVNSYEQIENSVLSFSDVPFEIKNGKLVGAFTCKNGRQPFEIEYHTENALVMTVNPGKENESIHVFITEEDMKNGPEKYREYINSLYSK